MYIKQIKISLRLSCKCRTMEEKVLRYFHQIFFHTNSTICVRKEAKWTISSKNSYYSGKMNYAEDK